MANGNTFVRSRFLGNSFGNKNIIDSAHNTINTLHYISNNVPSEVVDFGVNTLINNTEVIPKSIKNNATFVVGVTKTAEGILKTGEKLAFDGSAYVDSKVVGGATYIAGNIAGVFSKEAGETILNWGDKYVNDMKDFIAYDMIDNIDNQIYDNDVMQFINNLSYIKHDSEAAEALSKIGNITSEIALSTGAFVLSGGMASSVLLGAFEGLGSTSEKVYQIDKNTGVREESAIVLGGIAGALRFMMYARLGEGAINSVENISSMNQANALSGKSFVDVARSTFNNLKHQRFNDIVRAALRSNATDYAIADVTGGVTENISQGIINNKSYRETGAIVVREVLKDVALNTLLGGVGEYTQGMKFFLHKGTAGEYRFISLIQSVAETVDAAEDSDIINIDIESIIRGGN